MGHALIDKARALGYADAEIARRIGVGKSYVCNVANGRDQLSPECAALLAELIGEDARTALAAQTVERAKEPQKSRLWQALFQGREHGAASVPMLVALAVAAILSTTMCRLSSARAI